MTTHMRTLGPGTLKIGESSTGKNFDGDCIKVQLKPDTGKGDKITFLDGHSEADAQQTTWTLSGTLKEDYTAGGVQMFCYKNDGKELPFEWIPNKQGVVKATGKLIVAAVAFGGDSGSKNDTDFEFTVTELTIDESNSVA